ncbi:MAG: T9SS type A sorting domain-containing protein, partial [Taibaiella sp.]|nr:T9SS type A sorting domain-containing protein [Taibaiella sp.]
TTSTISFTASDDSVCAGDTVHYTASSNMSGGSYQWRVGSTNVATGTSYSYPPANGDVVRCVVTKATGTCYAPDTIAKDTTMTVFPNVVPAISITATADSVCPGRADTLTATTNVTGGSYQWLVNGSTAGTNSNTYIYQPANNDVVECVINAASAPGCYLPEDDTSNAVTITHTSSVIPSVAISVSPDTVICAGTSLTFTAAPTNGGTNPVYQWFRNGTPVSGATQNPYSGTGWQNNDVITCEMASTATCPIPGKDTSDGISIHVTPVTAPAVSIAANPGTTISQGTMVTFTATATDIGTSTAYQWYINSAAVGGAVNSTYMSNTLADMDQVTVTVYSNDSCSNPDSAVSNVLTMTVTSSVNTIESNSNTKIYPNPVKDKLTIVSGSMINRVEVSNLLGQKLIEREANGKNLVVDMSNLVTGIYIIKVNGSYVSRVVKE